ncbi:ester cyclase [Spongiactinospora sp. 9N601]|uniref:ester cyclase n=1 Tax=Spongiactinospora sp. 9N601 TaxID=3375149 RepID=UPI0037B3FEDC
MTLAKLAHDHLKAWEAGDATGVAHTVRSYTDPDTAGPLSGAELEEHAGAVMERLRGLRFEVEHVVEGPEAAVVSWTLRADHRTAYLGIPAAGRSFEVTGTDLVTGGAHVRRCFDRLAVAEALGYGPRFVPAADEVREYGVSARMTAAKVAPPGALALTCLQVGDRAEAAEVDLLSVEVVKSMRASTGFLGLATFDIGDRKFTLSAFDRPESVRAVNARPHQRAMRRFFRGGLCTRALISHWLPAAIREYARCPGCAGVVTVEDGTACNCGWVPDRASLL